MPYYIECVFHTHQQGYQSPQQKNYAYSDKQTFACLAEVRVDKAESRLKGSVL
jgi:hypothetical protein